MDNKDLIIIALIVATIYLYYQNRKQKSLFYSPDNAEQAQEISEIIANLKDENEDLVSEKDNAIRKKNEDEAEALDLGNKLKLKNQEVNRKDQEITRLKDEKSKVEIALNEKIKKVKEDLTSEKQQHKGSLERIVKLTEQKVELEQEKTQLLREISKHQDLDDFQTWLNEDENRKANLPEWDKIITELKQKIRDYHLSENNWASGLFKRNGNYWAIFKEWLESNHD